MQAKINKPNMYAQSAKDTETKNAPEKKIRSGAIAVTIWNNQAIKDGKVSDYKTVSFERNYKDKQGNWKTTNSLRMTDLPRAELVLRKAYEYLALQEQDSREQAIADEDIVY